MYVLGMCVTVEKSTDTVKQVRFESNKHNWQNIDKENKKKSK